MMSQTSVKIKQYWQRCRPAHLLPGDGLDAVEAVELDEQRLRVALHMGVVAGQQLHEELHLLLAHGLDEEPLVVADEEHAAGLAGGRQLPQRLVAWWVGAAMRKRFPGAQASPCRGSSVVASVPVCTGATTEGWSQKHSPQMESMYSATSSWNSSRRRRKGTGQYSFHLKL